MIVRATRQGHGDSGAGAGPAYDEEATDLDGEDLISLVAVLGSVNSVIVVESQSLVLGSTNAVPPWLNFTGAYYAGSNFRKCCLCCAVQYRMYVRGV